jgi:hypothetical protein
MITKLKESTMTGKLLRIAALNTSPLDNAFCKKMHNSEKKYKTKKSKLPNGFDKIFTVYYKEIENELETVCNKCYSCKMLNGIRKTCRKPWHENGEKLSSGIIPKNEVIETSSIYYRFNAHGELINMNHMINLMNIVKNNPKTKFALWTKRKSIVQKWLKENHKPDNVNFIYSNPVIQNNTENVNINCGARNCFDCAICYEKNSIVNVNELLK